MKGRFQMRLFLPGLAAIVVASTLPAQGKPSAAIPATAPTQSVSNLPSAHPSTGTSESRQGSIVWTGTTLSVNAGGDSLRSLLRQVARATGMKVTGGVPDEQVFGTYGPGSVQQVLSSLFNGLSVNMMLVNDSPTQPKELVLTARTGGPTPPSPAQPLNMTEDPTEVNLAQPRPGRHTSPDSFGQSPTQQPAANGAGPAVPLSDGTAGNAAPVTDANGQPASPNGVRTPEQIFDELRKRQQGTTAPQ